MCCVKTASSREITKYEWEVDPVVDGVDAHMDQMIISWLAGDISFLITRYKRRLNSKIEKVATRNCYFMI